MERYEVTHNYMVDHVFQRLEHNHLDAIVAKEFEFYSQKYHVKGESDGFAVFFPYAIAYEVKTTDTPKARSKAKKQLMKDCYYINREYEIPLENITRFYVYRDLSKWCGYKIRKIR